MAIIQPNDYIQNTGKVAVYVAMPLVSYVAPVWPFSPARSGATVPGSNLLAYSQLFKLGESTNEINPSREYITETVPGDSQGGTSGAGIEDQALGFRANINLEFSRWDPEVLAMLESVGGLYANGRVLDENVGALMRRDRSFRLLLFGLRSTVLIKNFPCCKIANSREFGMSTKWSGLRMNVTADRAPLGFWGSPALQSNGSLANGDLTTYAVENADVTGMT